MKTWYVAACYTCGEAIDIFVSNPSCTNAYLGEYNEQIQSWLSGHITCDMRLINEHMMEEQLLNKGFDRIYGTGLGQWIRVN